VAVSLRWIVLLHGKLTKLEMNMKSLKVNGELILYFMSHQHIFVQNLGTKIAKKKHVRVWTYSSIMWESWWLVDVHRWAIYLTKWVVSVLVFHVLLLLLDLAELCFGFHRIKWCWLSRLVAPARKYQHASNNGPTRDNNSKNWIHS
jgi:hypothetical protein